ncbi:unnamed protein product [Linum tenue]|uniref:DUF1365 domain-containing protein n=1 Tax=Linum tenue TaxID=586396 RepID=A0AAV0QIR6_9ROSI|nr:unnamed protein product [Linum tenue]
MSPAAATKQPIWLKNKCKFLSLTANNITVLKSIRFPDHTMELLYLLLSILSAFSVSLFHSLLLVLRRVFFNRLPQSERVTFYQGTVWHERRLPAHHSFRYSIRYALFDLDYAPHLPPDHLSPDEARRVAKTTGPVFLLTIPPSVGYEQNPLSLYYCYDGDVDDSASNLTKCIAEVTNTPWGERVAFVFNPNSDLVAKPLHVSPFMDMMGNWKIRASVPGDSLWVSISVQHPEHGDYFVATLNAKRTPVSDSDMFFWLMPHKVAVWIYWHALQLWWKNVEFVQHPRYSNPNYREEAVVRNQKLQCCAAVGCFQSRRIDPPASLVAAAATDTTGRWLKWRDAKWPWC